MIEAYHRELCTRSRWANGGRERIVVRLRRIAGMRWRCCEVEVIFQNVGAFSHYQLIVRTLPMGECILRGVSRIALDL